jgi:hypothetical protein
MPRPKQTAADISARLAELERQACLIGHRLDLYYPGGSAGGPSKEVPHYRLTNLATKKRAAVSPGLVTFYREQCQRGREVSRLRAKLALLL